MILLKAYQYLYFKLYRFYESSTYSRWWSDWKALTTIIVLEIWNIFSLTFYYQAFTGKSVNEFKLFDVFFWIIITIICLINWYVFQYQDKWKENIKQFDKLSKKKNKIGSIIILLFFLIIIFNAIFSIYTLSKSV